MCFLPNEEMHESQWKRLETSRKIRKRRLIEITYSVAGMHIPTEPVIPPFNHYEMKLLPLSLKLLYCPQWHTLLQINRCKLLNLYRPFIERKNEDDNHST